MVTIYLWLLLFHFGGRKSGDFRLLSTPLTAKPPQSDAQDAFEQSLQQMGFSDSTRLSIHTKLKDVGLDDTSELVALAVDFRERPEVFSSLLQSDFSLDPVSAHRTRAAVMNLLSESNESKVSVKEGENEEVLVAHPTRNGAVNGIANDELKDGEKRPLYKNVVVNEKAQKRRRRTSDVSEEKHDYGLPRNYREMYPILGSELDDFELFMTRPSTASQEAPIRPATATVYMRHAKLFLGWFLSQWEKNGGAPFESSSVSLFGIIPNKEKDSANSFLDFILWLRTARNISVSYEANVLRGLTKLLKFRFSSESNTDPNYGEKSFDDIPIIRELRKLHRDANKRQTLSPRSSDEDQKWLPWSEYLEVVRGLKRDLLQCIQKYENDASEHQSNKRDVNKAYSPTQRKIAVLYQQYLILSFLACVPDRQRTIRELELKRSFVRDKQNNVWTIKHGPDDYKTGKTYGDRPPLLLSPALVPEIDDFLERWRPCFLPKSDHLFIQPRTGNPLTQDSVYQIVGRCCYKYSGKRTNPHLLRDMIVTHVRESDASEKQLEALALYMGHSITMQRTSYDRRTLTKKVAPAVELLQSVNKLGNDSQEK